MAERGFADDGRKAEALAIPMDEVLVRLGLDATLRRAGVEWTGPCPQCGGDDRFSVNVRKGKFNCRICGAKGDGVGLVMHVRGVGFPQALDFLLGPRVERTPEELRAAEARAAKLAQARAELAARERRNAIAAARVVWEQGLPAEGTAVREYLRLRGLPDAGLPVLPRCLRFHPALRLMEMIDKAWVQVHVGPAMLAAVQGPDGRFIGVHRTYLDLGQPKGKAVVVHPVTGKALPAKKMLGSKKGGAIRLRDAGDGCAVLVMGEGIETTGTALVADAIPGAAYWAGVDLGNMAGQMVPVIGVRTSGIPDMGDRDAFVPPDWCRRLIFIRDGDSDPAATKAKLAAGLVRAQLARPGLVGQMVDAGDGRDLNDVLMRAG